ncbi:response regulator [Paenibacillus sp. NPDC056722]|uniref:response regulator transcription factor n=1 Tax=Paenibacillus sp. NPDC056722 TaxID=3345924 RepID=UPI00369A509D
MYGVMLVDDEKSVRSSIKSKIDWKAAGFEIVSEAGSASEALKLLKRKPLPQVIISDMRMPQMEGIEFIRICKEKYPGLRTVALSGYSDFEDLREAVRLGVKDYLLKPVAREELNALLAKLAADLREGQASAQPSRLKAKTAVRSEQLWLLQEDYLLQLVKGEWYSTRAVRERLAQLGLVPLAGNDLRGQFVAVEMHLPPAWATERQERRELLYQGFQSLCREMAARWKGVYPFSDFGNPAMMYFLISFKKEAVQENKSSRFLQELQKAAGAELMLDSAVGVGMEFRGLKNLKNGFASALWNWCRSREGDADNSTELQTLPPFSPGMERKLAKSIELCEMQAVREQLEGIFTNERVEDHSAAEYNFLALRVLLLLVALAGKYASGGSSLQKYLWNGQSLLAGHRSREWLLEDLSERAQHVIEEVQKTEGLDGVLLVLALRKYVEVNYGYELSLPILANKFHMTEADLSRLFKQHVGSSLSGYLGGVRAAKAEPFLQENILKLSDIAVVVGYAGPDEFSAAFKKHYGKTPKEYRERYNKMRSEA